MEGKILVRYAETSDEVIFPSLDCSFGRVALVNMGWCKLEIMFFFGHEALERFGTFVVETLQIWV